jgi:hypothetical protein
MSLGVKSKLGFILHFKMNSLKKIKSWLIIKAKKAKDNLKALGWLWGSLCVIISGIIFYSPAIYWLVLYFITGKAIYWQSASGYVIAWFLPMGTPALAVYGTILLLITTIVIKIKKAFKKRGAML